MKRNIFLLLAVIAICLIAVVYIVSNDDLLRDTESETVYDTGQAPVVPAAEELSRPFGRHDEAAFMSPPKVYSPETWFHYIGGNVSLEGITADLEAIAGAGLSGIQLFHGQFGGPWPGVDPQIACLSPLWDDAVKYTAEESRRLGLRFTMQNCPGWAMSGGPWIEPANAMRHLVMSRADIQGGSGMSNLNLVVPQPNDEEWRDYKDVAVIAFPTPEGDTGQPLKPDKIKSNHELNWEECLSGSMRRPFRFSPVEQDNPHWIEVSFIEPVMLRTVEFPPVERFNHAWCYDPGILIKILAVLPDGNVKDILCAEMPMSSWQDDQPISFACSEVPGVSTYRISIANKHDMSLRSLKLFSAARQNNYESEAGWTLRSIERAGENPVQSTSAYIDFSKVIDISDKMDAGGLLNWEAPQGKWTVLRIGHVNTGMRNGPAPPEGTGWECDKLSITGPDAHFAGYIGRLSGNNGPLTGGLLNGMLLDSWECKTQTWTNGMENEFQSKTDYPLRKWLPAVFGYVIDDTETTKCFLRDWRFVLGKMYTDNFFGRMAKHAKDNGLSISYETAAGDILPVDILEYFKYADVPMCEFWHPLSDNYVGSINFKPIKPTASSARMYGKPRVAAEAFTSFNLTWDEHFEMLKEVANMNIVEGVSHFVFHTYTHNPQKPFMPPGTSFGSGIGTPFLRGQTWWKHMPEFTSYLSRCNYMLERGSPVSDVLWYLGDEINHKPDQDIPFPEGFKYDYCNPDVLLNRLSVRDGMIFTPEGISYRVLWMPDAQRMLPQTLEKLYELITKGAIVIGNAPKSLITLMERDNAQRRFDKAVTDIWGETLQTGARKVGKGMVMSGMSIDEALLMLHLEPDVKGGDALWAHRKTEGADWYYVCAQAGKDFKGTLDFKAGGSSVELWDPITGNIYSLESKRNGNYTSVTLDLPKSGSCFIVFRKKKSDSALPAKKFLYNDSDISITLTNLWTLSFPSGWGAPPSLEITSLQPWKDLDVSDETKAFSGTATYTTSFEIDDISRSTEYLLDFGRVDMVAVVTLNGKTLRTLWTPPYRLDVTDAITKGKNTLTIEVTSTWFNRLVYDARQPESDRKTWTINGPSKDAELRESGLLGPVKLVFL